MELEGWQMNFEQFNKRFETNMSNTETYVDAYKATEATHTAMTGKRRYSSYNSFRIVKRNKSGR